MRTPAGYWRAMAEEPTTPGGSGVEVNAPIGIAYDFRGHKVSRCRAFLNHADALEAVGLEE